MRLLSGTATTNTRPPLWRRFPLLPEPTPSELMPRPRPLTTRTAYLVLGLAYLLVFAYPLVGVVLAVLAEGEPSQIPAPRGETLWQMALPQWILHTVLLTLMVGCLFLVCRWLRLPIKRVFAPVQETGQEADQDRRAQVWRTFAITFTALLVWMMGSQLLQQVLPSATTGGFGITDRADAVWTSLMLGPVQLTTALVEEPIVVGLLVVLLGAARRPAAEVYTIAVLAKLAYHAYYGLAVLALVPAALVSVWLYRHTGRLWPIILAHAVYNAFFSALVITWPTVFG